MYLFEEGVSNHNHHSASGWMLVNVAINGNLGTDKRIREKIERMTRLVREAGSKDYDSEQFPDGRQGLRDMASNDSQTPQQVRQITEERIAQEIRAREEAQRGSCGS